jgi:IS30 family transposase
MPTEAILAYRNCTGRPPTEAQGPPEYWLGGPPVAPVLAPAAARPHSAAMAKAHLSLEERNELEAGLRAGESQPRIATRLARAAATISREVTLHGGRAHYRAAIAHRAAQQRRGAARRGYCAIEEHPPLRVAVQARLRRSWAPEEIADSLRRDHPDRLSIHTSHESIYR